VGKPEGKRPLVRHRHRWEGSLKLELKGIDWEGMECINLAQDMYKREVVVNVLMYLWVTENVNLLEC